MAQAQQQRGLPPTEDPAVEATRTLEEGLERPSAPLSFQDGNVALEAQIRLPDMTVDVDPGKSTYRAVIAGQLRSAPRSSLPGAAVEERESQRRRGSRDGDRIAVIERLVGLAERLTREQPAPAPMPLPPVQPAAPSNSRSLQAAVWTIAGLLAAAGLFALGALLL